MKVAPWGDRIAYLCTPHREFSRRNSVRRSTVQSDPSGSVTDQLKAIGGSGLLLRRDTADGPRACDLGVYIVCALIVRLICAVTDICIEGIVLTYAPRP